MIWHLLQSEEILSKNMHTKILTWWGTNSSYPRLLPEAQHDMATRAVEGRLS